MTTSLIQRAVLNTQRKQRSVLLGLIIGGIWIPQVAPEVVQFLTIAWPIAFVLGWLGVQRRVPLRSAGVRWVLFNTGTLALAVYAAGVAKQTIPVVVIILFGLAFTAYDIIGVHGTGHIQTMASQALSRGVPMGFVVPYEPSFSMVAMAKAFRADGLSGLDQNETECRILGVGDVAVPAGIAATAGGTGPVIQLFEVTLTVPQIAGATSATVGLMAITLFEPRGPVAALVAGVPLAIFGVVVSILTFGGEFGTLPLL